MTSSLRVKSYRAQVLECLSSTNAKVQAAAAAALPVLCSCVDNPETQALKPHLMKAFTDPSTTLDCLEEIMCTTFVNAVDETSLAFIMPVVMRGLQVSNAWGGGAGMWTCSGGRR